MRHLRLCRAVLGFAMLLLVSRTSGAQSVPILVFHDSSAANPFGIYLGEILKAEGLNAFTSVNRTSSSLASINLASYRLVLLAEMSLSTPEAVQLATYVQNGGRLLAIPPHPGHASTPALA